MKLTQKVLALTLIASLVTGTIACKKDDDTTPNDVVNFSNLQLSGANQVPAVTNNHKGTLNAKYNKTTKVLDYTVTWDLDKDTLSAAHFHGAADEKTNAGVAVGITLGSTNLIPKGSLTSTATLSSTQESDLLAGKWYLNLHTNKFRAGGLRVQVK